MNKKISCIILFFILSVGYSYADKLNSFFQDANNLYKQEKYEDALNLYERLEFQNKYSAELFYNMSNAYYRLNNLGMAVLYNERAYLLKPRDEYIRYNRKLFNTITNQKMPLWENAVTFFSINELLYSVLFFYTSFFILLILSGRFYPRWIYWTKIAVLSLLILFACWSFVVYWDYYHTKHAVVLNDNVNVYSGPDTDNVVGFTAPKGKKAQIITVNGSWFEVGVKDEGLKGWVEKENVLVI
ncbi:MAG: SH3 domain-containing protein [Elusimicrobiota bacterium]